jgi:hypothetical protein
MKSSSSVRESNFTQAHQETAKDLTDMSMEAFRTEPDYSIAIQRLQDPRTVRLLHAAMGMATEACEFVDMLKKHVFYGRSIDFVNAIEEIGDSNWYERIGADACGASLLEAMLVNIRKLRKRYPPLEGFSEGRAAARDLMGEREILEGGGSAGEG